MKVLTPEEVARAMVEIVGGRDETITMQGTTVFVACTVHVTEPRGTVVLRG